MSRAAGSKEVDEFIAKLDHPLKPELQAVRAILAGASPAISEGVKWNAASFRTTEWFATANIRKDEICVILHLGAKVKDNSTKGMAIDDPNGLLKWLAKDRAMIAFGDMQEIKASKAALVKIVRQWIGFVR